MLLRINGNKRKQEKRAQSKGSQSLLIPFLTSLSDACVGRPLPPTGLLPLSCPHIKPSCLTGSTFCRFSDYAPYAICSHFSVFRARINIHPSLPSARVEAPSPGLHLTSYMFRTNWRTILILFNLSVSLIQLPVPKGLGASLIILCNPKAYKYLLNSNVIESKHMCVSCALHYTNIFESCYFYVLIISQVIGKLIWLNFLSKQFHILQCLRIQSIKVSKKPTTDLSIWLNRNTKNQPLIKLNTLYYLFLSCTQLIVNYFQLCQ